MDRHIRPKNCTILPDECEISGLLENTPKKKHGNLQKESQKTSPNLLKICKVDHLVDDFYSHILDWSNNNIYFASCDKLMQFNFTTNNMNKVYETEANIINAVKMGPSKVDLCFGTSNGTITFLDINTQRSVSVRPNKSRIGVVEWVSDFVLASGGRDKCVKIFDMRVKNEFVSVMSHKQEVCGLKLNCDGTKLASGGNDNKLIIYDIRYIKQPLNIFTGHKAAVKAISWSKQCPNLLVSGGGTLDKTIKLWDINKSEPASIYKKNDGLHRGVDLSNFRRKETDEETYFEECLINDLHIGACSSSRNHITPSFIRRLNDFSEDDLPNFNTVRAPHRVSGLGNFMNLNADSDRSSITDSMNSFYPFCESRNCGFTITTNRNDNLTGNPNYYTQPSWLHAISKRESFNLAASNNSISQDQAVLQNDNTLLTNNLSSSNNMEIPINSIDNTTVKDNESILSNNADSKKIHDYDIRRQAKCTFSVDFMHNFSILKEYESTDVLQNISSPCKTVNFDAYGLVDNVFKKNTDTVIHHRQINRTKTKQTSNTEIKFIESIMKENNDISKKDFRKQVSLKQPLIKNVKVGAQICNLYWTKNDEIISTQGYSNHDIRIYDKNLALKEVLYGHKGRVIHFAISENENNFVTGSTNNLFYFWKLDNLEKDNDMFSRL
ncbi:hypothetical protein EDEG_01334 [Edhazardia aedis USNM 41457]|uniref:Anaphase-promoting complex subunit 4 WD40 domain-containing protein n=1 Tax=Edhazardia aedis (strain USNM 41457) TaxID=1003232 RepID=J9DAD1_EDHAE|nr:hypothetical protein EDEG_01334 [Edhazardia aedis USNM 41457]|eukprot:EJW04464.1 hypothetical protein EDEG_01334 [Edhazardia aedis USNM 41457]